MRVLANFVEAMDFTGTDGRQVKIYRVQMLTGLQHSELGDGTAKAGVQATDMYIQSKDFQIVKDLAAHLPALVDLEYVPDGMGKKSRNFLTAAKVLRKIDLAAIINGQTQATAKA